MASLSWRDLVVMVHFMRVGGTIYYDRADIEKMFEKFKTPAAK